MIWPENQLLLACMTGEPIAFEKLLARCDSKLLFARAKTLGLKHILFDSLKRYGQLEAVPSWLAQDLEADYFKNAARNTILLDDAEALIRACREKLQVNLLPLKGIALLFEGVYTNPALRTLSDIDLLVKEESIAAVEKLLMESGFHIAPWLELEAKEYRKLKNHAIPYVSPKGSPVEIHWCFEPYHPKGEYKDHSKIFESGKSTPSPEEHLLMLAIHLTKSDLFRFSALSKTVLDWRMLLQKYPVDWSYVHAEISRRSLHFQWRWMCEAMEQTGFKIPAEAKLQFDEPRIEIEKIRQFLWYANPTDNGLLESIRISLKKEIYPQRKFQLVKRLLQPGRVVKGLRALILHRKIYRTLRSPEQLSIAAQSFYLLSRLSLEMKVRPLDQILVGLNGSGNDQPAVPEYRDTVETAEWVLGLFKPTCLKRSLLLFALLRRRGIPVVHHFGVKKTGDKLNGHSWLTLHGEVFLEDPTTMMPFTETLRYPSK